MIQLIGWSFIAKQLAEDSMLKVIVVQNYVKIEGKVGYRSVQEVELKKHAD